MTRWGGYKNGHGILCHSKARIVRAKEICALPLPNSRHTFFCLLDFSSCPSFSALRIFFTRSFEGEMHLSTNRVSVRSSASL
jgi:hypothetical protein